MPIVFGDETHLAAWNFSSVSDGNIHMFYIVLHMYMPKNNKFNFSSTAASFVHILYYLCFLSSPVVSHTHFIKYSSTWISSLTVGSNEWNKCLQLHTVTPLSNDLFSFTRFWKWNSPCFFIFFHRSQMFLVSHPATLADNSKIYQARCPQAVFLLLDAMTIGGIIFHLLNNDIWQVHF